MVLPSSSISTVIVFDVAFVIVVCAGSLYPSSYTKLFGMPLISETLYALPFRKVWSMQ